MPPEKSEGIVPETGFEPAHPFRRHHLKVVRLPISPPGLLFSCFFRERNANVSGLFF